MSKISEMFDVTAPSMPMLVCAGCGHNCTHQERVEVFARNKEDSDHGCHVVVKRISATVDSDVVTGNPSGRRDGTLITLSCEQCSALTAISIYQHKGSTFVESKVVGGAAKSHE